MSQATFPTGLQQKVINFFEMHIFENYLKNFLSYNVLYIIFFRVNHKNIIGMKGLYDNKTHLYLVMDL